VAHPPNSMFGSLRRLWSPWTVWPLCAITAIPLHVTSTSHTSQSPANTQTYFPKGADGFSGFFSSYLSYFGEPSLLAAAHDPGTLSYRFECLSAQNGYVLVIRLYINSDGTPAVIRIEQSGTPPVIRRAQNGLSTEDFKKFTQLVERAEFWSMPSLETAEHARNGRTPYKMDADIVVFEGVRNGNYHAVLRRGYEPNPFTELVVFLARNLANVGRAEHP